MLSCFVLHRWKKTQVNDVRQVIYSLSLTEEFALV